MEGRWREGYRVWGWHGQNEMGGAWGMERMGRAGEGETTASQLEVWMCQQHSKGCHRCCLCMRGTSCTETGLQATQSWSVTIDALVNLVQTMPPAPTPFPSPSPPPPARLPPRLSVPGCPPSAQV